MPIDRETIIHLTQIYRMNITEEEIEEFSYQLEDILKQFEILQEVQTASIEAFIHEPIELNALRSDSVGVSLNQEEVLLNAPAKHSNHIVFPQIIEYT
ncbi:MAG: Asp-tRNA(Asn)/Glu-tRNA(Gln) amidotransferase GatCAB subunit C [Chloroflexi bacterium]|nr:Asp-tRNA(Asn)/Glu-tRNA(Gln) amidotransferase GatCAB subunit C [Chloroflexota bacterium]